MKKPNQFQSNFALNFIACFFVLFAIVGIGWLSFSKQALLNDLYATSAYTYHSDSNADWKIGYDVETFSKSENLAVADSVKILATDKRNNQQEKKTGANVEPKEMNIMICLFIEAFNYLYESGVLQNPF